MKKIIVILFVFIILFISFWWSFDYISRDGEFTKWSHSRAGKEHFDDNNVIYLGYNFKWEGIGNPLLVKVEFIKKDGTIVTKDDDEIHIEPYIARTERIGVLDEETVMKEGLNEDLINVKDFQVDEDFYLVLRVKFNGTIAEDDINTLKIKYKKYGVTQYQNIPFDEGVMKDE
ncbi:hypothetical protein ACFSCX_22150 [Bacillus salitolerans]|uniref:Uncharacterized protein n=1 Tax=Bacillus salitolerans TaxID=1437434 RepID=A0ABW4LVI4_9BACI